MIALVCGASLVTLHIHEAGHELDLLDRVGSGEVLRPHSDPGRLRHELRGQLLDGRGPGGREHQRLPVCTRLRGNCPDVGLKPQVQHSISLIQDQIRDA